MRPGSVVTVFSPTPRAAAAGALGFRHAGTPGGAPPDDGAKPIPAEQQLIGADLERIRRELIEIGGQLAEVLEPAGAGMAREAVRILSELSCRIAVVGQIKSGKTTFINALIGQPGLLPTDINPWTTAVTSLHFCQQAPDGHRAVFKFFSTPEWEALGRGSSRLSELTMRLVPGYQPALLQHQVASLRERARVKLGQEFEALIGREHRFETFEHALLAQYVCAGDERADGVVGRYSEITQSAALHLDGGPFAFPVSIIDTPGTNDPLMMRDAITHDCLDKADAYVVVITAHQALSDSDVSLLRLLRGLHKDRLVAFVNRIDELENVDCDTAEVVRYVQQRLAIEFPGSQIPVIAGSAWLEAGAAKETPVAPGDAPRMAAALEGRRRMRSALNAMLERSHSAYVIRQLAQCFGEILRASDAAARRELATLERLNAEAQSTAQRSQAETLSLEQEEQDLGHLRSTIESTVATIEGRLPVVMRQDVAVLRQRLQSAVDAAAATAREELIDTVSRHRHLAVWTCDTIPLRRQLARIFIDSFRQSEAHLTGLTGQITAILRHVATSLSAEAVLPCDPEPPQDVMAAPSMTALGRYLALDLDDSWWARLWRARPTPEKRGDALAELFKSEFAPVIEDLVRSYSAALEAYVGTTSRWSLGACQSIVAVLARRQEQIAAHVAHVRLGVDGRADAATLLWQGETLVRLQERCALGQQLAGRLEQANRRIETCFD